MPRKSTIINKMTDGERKQVEDNINLVHYLVHKYSWSKENYDDYFQVGSYGLCLAVQRFDKNRGIEFSTYASNIIIGYMLRHYRDFMQGPIRPTRIGQSSDVRKPTYIYADGLENENGETINGFNFIGVEDSKEDEAILHCDIELMRTKFKKHESEVMNLSLKGKTQMEISEILKISQAQVSRIKARLRKKFFVYIK